MDDWYKTISCADWDDFLIKANALPENMFLYRGQSNFKQPLLSSFDRAVNASRPLVCHRWLYEAAIVREFKRKAHHYILETPKSDDLLEWLSLMRHHGAPTRLVDFTYSLYIAAYFAFCNVGCQPRAIWAINKDYLDFATGRHVQEFLNLPQNEIDLHIPEHFTRCFFSPDRKNGTCRSFVAAVSAERMNKRLTIQQGIFLCPGDIERSFDENMGRMVSKPPDHTFFKFVVPHAERNRALTELSHMNISMATLFPDLDGLAKSLNDRMELLFRDHKIPEQPLKRLYIV